MAELVVDYYFSLASPFTYMGHERFTALAARYGARVNHKPAAMGEVFAASGGLPVGQRAPQRQAYRFMELRRWREHLQVPLNLEPRHFPVDDSTAARMVIAAEQSSEDPAPLTGAVLRAVWAEERNIADPETLRAIAAEQGYDAEALEHAARSEAAGTAYEANTREAIERGVFGAPTWIIGEELLWGQDRLDFVERELAARTGR